MLEQGYYNARLLSPESRVLKIQYHNIHGNYSCTVLYICPLLHLG